MNTAARLSVHSAVLALQTAGAYATGSAVGPFSSATATEHAEASGAEVPSAATYRLFLDLQHPGVVRTAEFTLRTATAGGAPAQSAETTEQSGHGHDTRNGHR